MDHIVPGHLQFKEYNCLKILKDNVKLEIFLCFKVVLHIWKYQKLYLTYHICTPWVNF